MSQSANTRSTRALPSTAMAILAAVIGMLAMTAMPGCQGYLARAQVAEGFSLVTTATNAVTEYYAEHGTLPDSNSEAGLPLGTRNHGHYVASVQITSDGSIKAIFDAARSQAALQGQTLVLEPQLSGGSITWTCAGTVAPQALPAACANRVAD